MSGIDGGAIRAERYDDRLGFVGQVTSVDASFFTSLVDAGVIPVVAPIGLEPPSQALNINADTVAGELARAVEADRLLFLTDVDGLMDAGGTVVRALGVRQAVALREEGVLAGGMIPKVDACFRAAEVGTESYIANGTLPGTVQRLFSDERPGTHVGGD